MSSQPDPQPLRMGYLVSRYPAVSHTFILREVLALRERGIKIDVASINDPPSENELTPAERTESDRTFYIKREGTAGALKAIGWLLLHHPRDLARGLVQAMHLGGTDPRRILLCLFYWIEAAILARWAQKRSLTHVHVHFATPAATVALIATSIASITLSITVHGPDEFYDVPGYYLERKIARTGFIVCISFFAQSQLMKLTPGEDWHKFDLARLGVDLEHFAPRPFRAAPSRFQVLCVGRLVSSKGQRILIEAIELLVNRGHSLHLRLIGDGPDRQDLQRLVRERGLAAEVTFEGAVNQDRIRDFYREADIFALASFAEGIPVVLMEAMAMEIPSIATGINGIPELIRDGIDGLLVAPSDIEGMAAALESLIEQPRLREILGKAGRKRVEEQYTLSKSIDRLSEVFHRRLEHLQ